MDRQPFRSVNEAAPDAQQPLIWARPRNISQTAREQCELAGYVQEGLERPGPGQVGACCWTVLLLLLLLHVGRRTMGYVQTGWSGLYLARWARWMGHECSGCGVVGC